MLKKAHFNINLDSNGLFILDFATNILHRCQDSR